MSHTPSAPIAQLEADGLLRRESDGRHRTTRRWQAAMARAACRLVAVDHPSHDLRVPVALALVELYGARYDDAELVAMIEALAEIERYELAPAATAPAPPP